MDCTQVLAAQLGCPSSIYANWRAIFPSFGIFARFLAVNYSSLRFRLLGGSYFLEGKSENYVNVFCYQGTQADVYHVDPTPSSTLVPIPIAHLSRFLDSLQVYGSTSPSGALLPTPKPAPAIKRNNNKNNNQKQKPRPQAKQVGRSQKGKAQGPAQGPKPRPKVAPQPAVPVPPPVVIVNSTYDWWFKLVSSFNVTPGSQAAASYLEDNGFSKHVNTIVSHAHPLSRAKRYVFLVKLLAHFFNSVAQGVPYYWVRPTNSLENFANRILRERSAAIMTLAQAANFTIQGRPASFDDLNVVQNGARVKAIVCDSFDRTFDAYAIDSLFCFRMWRSGSRASVDSEVTVDPFDPVSFPLRNNAAYPATPQWWQGYEDDLLHIQVVGSGAYIEPGDLLFHMSTFYSAYQESLKFLVTPCSVGDYGLFQLIVNNPQSQVVTEQFASVLAPQTFTVSFPQIPQILWSLCGDSAVDLVPSGWFERVAEVVNVPLLLAQTGHFGGAYASGTIAKAVDSHPIIKDHSRPLKIRTEILVSSVAYYAYQTASTTRRIARASAQAGASTGTMDDNRNYFKLGSYLGCCGQRIKHVA